MHAYLDNNATTAIDLRVLARMNELYALGPLNPGSAHRQGRQARELFENAKRRVLAALGLPDYRIIFCASASEAINLALRSFAGAHPQPNIATSSIEHPVMARTIAEVATPHFFRPDRSGHFDAKDMQAAISDAALVATMFANNESGAILPIEELAAEAARQNKPILIDACQAPGKTPAFFSSVASLRPSALVLSGHKIHAPIGVAVLVAHPSFPLRSQTSGGSQQSGLRAGTEAVVLADAFALALELANHERDFANMRNQREHLWQAILEAAPTAERTIAAGHPCLANTLHYRIPGLSAERQIIALDLAGISLSSSSACESGAAEPSKVLLGMGFTKSEAQEGIRVSLSRQTSEEEVTFAQATLKRVLSKLIKA